MPNTLRKITILHNTHPSKRVKYYIDNNLLIPEELQSGYISCVRSQLLLAKFIEKHSDEIFIYENNYGLKPNMYPTIDAKAKKIFPNHIPDKESLLTKHQKDFLAYYGAVPLCVGKNIIKGTHSDSNFYLSQRAQFHNKIGIKDQIKTKKKEALQT